MIYKVRMPEDEGKKYQRFTYPAGETQVRLMESEFEAVSEAEEIRVYCTIKNGDIMPLALLTDALFDMNNGTAERNILVLPYLPYGRADRRFVQGDCSGLRVFGKQIDELGYNLVVTVDAHSPVTRSSISNFVNVSPEPFIKKTLNYLSEIHNPRDITILLPDKGADRYKKMLKGYNVVQGSKIRNTETGAFEKFYVPWIPTKVVLVVDDLCDGGGTFTGIAKEIDNLQTLHKYLYVTHGVFSKGTDVLLENYDHIFTTDTFQRASEVTIMYSQPEIDKAIDELTRD